MGDIDVADRANTAIGNPFTSIRDLSTSGLGQSVPLPCSRSAV